MENKSLIFRFCKNPSPICFQVNKHMRNDHTEWVYFFKMECLLAMENLWDGSGIFRKIV